MRFPQGVLSAAEALEKTSVGSQAGVKVGSVFGELPSLRLQFETLREERPIQRRHPVGDAVAFVDPCLIVGVMGGELGGGKLVDSVASVPVVLLRLGCCFEVA